jgi:hypothetical protein
MSGSASLELERQLLQHTLAIAPMATLARVYVALCETAPTEAAGGSELAGGGYARTAATFTLLSMPANAAANATAVDFAPATGDWRPISHFELWTAATGGTRLYWGQLVDPTDGAPIEIDVLSGSAVRFSPGSLVVQATEITATGGGTTWLPTAGGEMTGPLLYTATGGTTARSLQDWSADVANVLDYGADPTGVADSAPAINAAAAQVAPNGRYKSVYLPAGTYHVRSQITLTQSQGMFGDTRGSSVLTVRDDFDPGAAAVILCRAALQDPGPVLRDFGITFAQPADQASRANFKTLGAGGTSGAGGSGVKYPWAIASGDDAFRIQITRVRIAGAWGGISTNNRNTVFWLNDIEMGALECGVSIGEGVPTLDFQHINGYHFWNFGISGALFSGVFGDGQTTSLRIGRADGMEIRHIGSFWGRIVFTGESAGTSCNISNCLMDGYPAGIEILGAGINHLHIANFYGSAGTTRFRPLLTVAAPAYVTINNWYSHSSAQYPDIALSHGSGRVIVSNFHALFHTAATSWITVSAGLLHLLGGWLQPGNIVRTAPAIAQSGTGILVVDNVEFFNLGAGSGVVIDLSTNTVGTRINSINLAPGWTINAPSLTSTILGTTTIKGGLFTEGGAQVGLPGGGAVSFALTGAAGQQKSLIFYSGNNLRWAMLCSSATDDLSIGRWNDAGTFLGTPVAINRATGAVSLAALAASTSYASDATAAAGGVAIGQLYRNGSIVMVRVA